MAIYYFHRTDVIGLILLAFSFGLLLVPATIATTMEGGYSNRESSNLSKRHRKAANPLARIIAMFVIGAVLWFLFIGYEWKLAKFPIMPKRVLNRSLVSCLGSRGSCLHANRIDLLHHH
jgi:hypothetical protein